MTSKIGMRIAEKIVNNLQPMLTNDAYIKVAEAWANKIDTEIAPLREALERYGGHSINCLCFTDLEADCECGFSAILAESKL